MNGESYERTRYFADDSLVVGRIKHLLEQNPDRGDFQRHELLNEP